MLEAIKTMKVWKKSKYIEWTEQELHDFFLLLRNISVVARVTATSRIVNVIKFREFCIQEEKNI